MCKHNRTSEVTTQLGALGTILDGTIVVIHQCDMCGMTVPEKRTVIDDDPGFDILSLPAIDNEARERVMNERIENIRALPIPPPNKAWTDSIARYLDRRLPTGSRWGKFKRKSVPGSR